MNLYTVIKPLACCIGRMCHNVSYEGLENIPKNKGCIICCNHFSNWDAIFLANPIKRQIHFLAKKELYKFKLFGWILKKLGAIYVDRDSKNFNVIDIAVSHIRNNRFVGIFPEGKRSKTGELLKPKAGAAMVALKTNSDILPVGIKYEKPLKFRSKAKVTFGKIIHSNDFYKSEQTATQIRELSKLIMEKISDCL